MIDIMSKNLELAKAEIRSIYDDSVAQHAEKSQHARLGYMVEDVAALNEMHAVYDTLSMAEETGEREIYVKDELTLKGLVGVKPVKYTKSVDVTEEALRFGDRWRIVTNQSAQLYPTIDKRISREAFGILGNGFDAGSLVGVDGKILFADDHVLTRSNNKKPGVYSNYLGTVALSYDELTKAITKLNNIPEEDGTPSDPVTNHLLVVSEDDRHVAQQLQTAPGIFTSPNLATNAYSGVDVLITNWIPSKTWFLIDKDRVGNYFMMKRGWEPTLKFDEMSDRGLFSAYISAMFQFIYTDAKFIVGSAGA